MQVKIFSNTQMKMAFLKFFNWPFIGTTLSLGTVWVILFSNVVQVFELYSEEKCKIHKLKRVGKLRISWSPHITNSFGVTGNYHNYYHSSYLKMVFLIIKLVVIVIYWLIISHFTSPPPPKGYLLNRFPGTQSYIKSLKVIWAKPQSMTKKCRTVIQLNRPKQHIM